MAPRTPVPSAGFLLGLLTCSASGPELPAPATEHSCEPAPPLPRWVGLTRIQATHRAPLRSPLGQSSKVGREPGPPATVRWAWGSRRAPPSPHRIKAELSAIFGERLFAVHRRESTTRLWARRRVGRGLCWGWGAPRAPPSAGDVMPSLPRVYSSLPAAVIPPSETAPPPQQKHRPVTSPVTVPCETPSPWSPCSCCPILLSGCAASGPACSRPGGGRGERQTPKFARGVSEFAWAGGSGA